MVFFYGENMATSSFLNVNGYNLPCPRYGFQYVISTAVDAGRNLNNVVVGQKVGRDIVKLDTLQWVGLDPATRCQILSIFDKNFFVDVTFMDYRTNSPITRKMYVGDRTVKPLFTSKDGRVTVDELLAFNLIDCGK